MRQDDMQKVLKIGVLLSSERDIRRLLNKALECVMAVTRCDAGTLYLLENDALYFKVSRNNTLKNFAGGDQDPDLPPVPLTRSSVCSLSFLENTTIRADDVRNNSEYDFTGPIKYDAMTGYYTKSMLVTPMRNRKGVPIGVLQLINAMDHDGNICPFSEDTVLLVESIASQAAVAIQNTNYIEEIQELFQSFVRVMSSAIDERTPYNASHSRRMALCGAKFVDYLNEHNHRYHFTPDEKTEFIMSIWLHDIGKLVTPLEVMNKSARLLPEQYTAFTHRMEVIRLLTKIELLSGKVTQAEYDAIAAEIEQALEVVEKADRASFLPDETLSMITEISQKTYTDAAGVQQHWLTEEEYRMLSIRRGTLSANERKDMEDHVVVTGKLLDQICFSEEYSHIRVWAGSHHEFLNGTGYPAHLAGDQIPWQVRIITILDIFDALVAHDRPYKPAMPVEKALEILTEMAEKEGKLDAELTRLYIESRCWEGVS